MTRLVALARFLWDFVIGDDWRIALGVAVALALTALLDDGSVAVWWIVPLAVALMLGLSVWTAARQRA